MESRNKIVDELSKVYRDSRANLNNLKLTRTHCERDLNDKLSHRDYTELENRINEYNKEIELLEKYIDGLHDAREIVMRIVL